MVYFPVVALFLDGTKVQYLLICNLNIPFPGTAPPPLQAFEFLHFCQSNSSHPVPKSCLNAPHVRPVGWAKAPLLAAFFTL